MTSVLFSTQWVCGVMLLTRPTWWPRQLHRIGWRCACLHPPRQSLQGHPNRDLSFQCWPMHLLLLFLFTRFLPLEDVIWTSSQQPLHTQDLDKTVYDVMYSFSSSQPLPICLGSSPTSSWTIKVLALPLFTEISLELIWGHQWTDPHPLTLL